MWSEYKTQHSNNCLVITEAVVEVRVTGSVFNLSDEHRLKLLDPSDPLQAEQCVYIFILP